MFNWKRWRWDWALKAYWNNRWQQKPLVYTAQGGFERDVRTLIPERSYILQPIADHFKKIKDFDERMLAILKYWNERLTYVGDITNNKVPEQWEHPEITYQKRMGDCEDGAIAIATIAILSGVPNWRVKVIARDVVTGPNKVTGHAHCEYLSIETNEWYTLDWCYWFDESVLNLRRLPTRFNKKYADVWFSFNNEFTWSSRSGNMDDWWKDAKP